jgi:hypothetical protein
MTSPEPLDVATAARDDALLTALGRGEAAPADDELALMLSAWRADLAADAPAATRPRRRSSWRIILAAAAAVVAFIGGLTIAAGGAGPDSPLWPITQLVYPERADSRAAERDAEHTIAQARRAVAEQRYADAARLLDQATVDIRRIHDGTVARRLLDEVAALRALLPGSALPPGPAGGNTPTPAPSPGAGGATEPGGGSGGQPTGGGPLPGVPLPTLPTPSLPGLPLPTLPLPTLPTLPLPTLPTLPTLPG